MSLRFKRVLKTIATFTADQYVVIFFSLALGIKFHIFNGVVTQVTWYSDLFIIGIICGYIVAALLFTPAYFLHKWKVKISFIIALALSLLLFIDCLYFSYYRSLPSVGLLNIAGQTKDILPAIGVVMKPKYFLFFGDLILFLFLHRPFRRLVLSWKKKYKIGHSSRIPSIVVTVLIVVSLVSTIISLGLDRLSNTFERGYDTISTSQPYGVFLAQIMDTARYVNQELAHLSPSEQQGIVTWIKNNRPNRPNNELTGVAKGKNVIMIQVESLGGFTIDQTINNKEITPNLNKLSKESYYYPNDRFLYGAGHTSDSDFVANTSYFPLMDAAVFVRYGNTDFTSLPKTLIANGYSAYAYHGFNRNFWNRSGAYSSLGYQKFYAADNYPKGKQINMGLNDGDFLDKTADFIKSQPKPSFSYVVTLSSHTPFGTYSETKELGVDVSKYPEQVGGYLENINYVDRMLGKFFDKLKANGLYDDSLILLYGDHTPVLPAFEAGTIKYDPDGIQQKEVPLLVKLPNQTVGKTYANTGNHTDIMPTVLDLVGIKKVPLMFGQSLFVSDNGMRTCQDQLVSFKSTDCINVLNHEKYLSSQIIRYNQFDNLKKAGIN